MVRPNPSVVGGVLLALDAAVTRRLLAVSLGWIGLSMVGDGLPAVLLPHRVLSDGGDASTLGLVTLVAIALAALLQPLAGAASDRVGRMPVIAAGSLVTVAGLSILLLPGSALVAAIVTLCGVSIAQAGQQALLPDRIGHGWRGRAGGLKGLFDIGGAFLAFAVLGLLLADGAVALAIAVLGMAVVAAAFATWLLGRDGRIAPDTPLTIPAVRGERVPSLALLTVARFLFLVGIYGVGRFLVLFVADRTGTSPDAAAAAASGLLAVLALATALASLPSGWAGDRLGRRLPMALGGLVAALGIGLLTLAGSLEAMILPGVLMAVGTALFGAASWAAMSDSVDARSAGRSLGLANFGTAGAAALAGLLGPVIDGVGFGPAFGVAAALAMVGGALPLADTSFMRRLSAPALQEEP